MGEWSYLDSMIDAAERTQEHKAKIQEVLDRDWLERVNRNKFKNVKGVDDFKNMSWDDVENFNTANTPESEHYFEKGTLDAYNDDNVSNPKPRDMKRECQDLIRKILKNKNTDRYSDEIYLKLYKVSKLLWKLDTENQSTVSDRKPEMIADEPEISVTKSIIEHVINSHAPIFIEKSDNKIIVSGFATSNIKDHVGEVIEVGVMKQALETYLKDNNSILFGHQPKPIGHMINHTWKKTPSGNDGLYISCELFNSPLANSVAKGISEGVYQGFSVGGVCNLLNPICDYEKICHKNVMDFELFEISIVEKGCNPDAKIDKIEV